MLGQKKNHLNFSEIFGGASAMTPSQFKLVNGFSNQYWGWGGEDDDMYKRIDKSKLKIQRYKADISRYGCNYYLGLSETINCRYTMIKHTHEESNKANPERFNMLKKAEKFQKTDGLNNLK